MRTKEMTAVAILATILVVSQFAFSFIVGINLVFPLLFVYTYNLGFKKGMLVMIVFVIVRFVLGLPFLTVILWLWTFSVLVLLAHIANKASKGNEYVAASVTFLYFIIFGLLASVQEAVLTETPFYAYWVRGIPSDLLGAIAGFVTTLVLLKPLSGIIQEYVFELKHQRY